MLLLSLSAMNYKRGDRKVWFAAGGERGRVCGHAKTRWPFSYCPRALCTAGPFLGHGRHLPRKCLCWGVPWGPGGLHGAWGGSIQGSVLLFALLEAARGARSCVVAGPDGTTRRVPPRARGTGRAQEPSLSRSHVLVQILLFLGLPGL